MQIVNETPFSLFVHRDHLDDSFAMVDATVKTTHERIDGGWQLSRECAPISGEPSERFPMGEAPCLRENGLAELTVSGTVRAPDGRAFRRRTALLRIGDQTHSILAFGRRWWRHRNGAVEPSDAELTEGVEMVWSNAYGGSWTRPPGLLPHTKLPAPTTRILCSANPAGKGWVMDVAEAEGVELPQLEDPEQPIVAWDTRPAPSCWAPMPSDTSLRMDHFAIKQASLGNRHELDEFTFARGALNAPPQLQRRDLHPNTRIEVEGLGPATISFIVPEPAIRWRVTAGARERRRRPALVAVHIDADTQRVELAWHATLYAPLISGERRTFTLEPDVTSRSARATG